MKKQIVTLMAAGLSASLATAQVPAFPGAEGHGRYVTGGRGGQVVHVTNLNNSGAGSLRNAVNGSGKKIVVFDVAGVIALQSDLTIGDNTTIAGQTAPYPGITLRYYTLRPGSNNIIRFIRIRRGEEKDVNDGADCLWQRNKNGIMLDHCSFSWSIDEVASFYDNNNFTMQWCTLGESLNNAGHSKEAHGYGGIWGGKLASFHHNMIAHVNNRSPRFNGARYNWTGYTGNSRYAEFNWENAVQAENVDFRNCVIYNCGNGCYGGPGGGQINIVNNYYKTGPTANTTRVTDVSIANNTTSRDNKTYWDMTSRYYINGNQVNANANRDWTGITYDSGVQTINGERYTLDVNHYYGSGVTYVKNASGQDCVKIKMDSPTDAGEVTTHSAPVAFEKVLAYAGSSLHRDEVDERYVTEARNGTATYMGSVTKQKGRIDKVSDVNGYTEDNFPTGSRPADWDSDRDGMPDAWETANGLNPNSASDASQYTLDTQSYYTNLEVYLNSLVEDIMKSENEDALSTVNEYWPLSIKTDDNPGPTPDPTDALGTGSIIWPFDTGSLETGNVGTDLVNYIASPTITLGSNLNLDNTKGVGDFRETMITTTVVDEGPSLANAVTYTITPHDGVAFTPTNISFYATRIGTDHGSFSATWKNSDGTTAIVAPEQVAARNNATPPYTLVDKNMTNAKASTGPCSLVINVWDVPAGKQFGLYYVVVSGKVTSTTAINGISDESPVLSRRWFTTSGMEVKDPQQASGVLIEVSRKANGQTQTRKVMR